MKRLCLLLVCLCVAVPAGAQETAPPAGPNPSSRVSSSDGDVQTPSAAAAQREAEQPPAPSRPATVFRAAVDLVALSVVVTDAQSNFVTGLTAQDFDVYEDGVRQDVSFFAASSVPLDLAILLDTSASMSDKMQTAQEAAIGFASTLGPSDRVMIVDIKDATRVLQPLTSDVPGATQAIEATAAKGGTALYNGLYLTLKEMVKERRGHSEVRRQAIVVLSDGADTASLLSFDDVMAEAKASSIAIYTIMLRSSFMIRQAAGRTHFSQAEFSMRSLAQETGARAFFPAGIGELAGVYGTIADELASQYALAYTPSNTRKDGAFRRIVVRVADHPGVRTRTRSGYVSPRPERTRETDASARLGW